MVDAIFCSVSIIIILILAIPQNQSQRGQIAQADLVVSCSMHNVMDYTIRGRRNDQKERADDDLHVTVDMDFPSAVVAIRNYITHKLAEVGPQLSARVAITFVGPDRICVDAIVCALARRRSECINPDVPIREEVFGETMPLVTVLYGTPSRGR